MPPTCPLPFVSLINIKPAPTCPSEKPKQLVAIWLALAFKEAVGIEEKKQKHLIYSSIHMEINGFCLAKRHNPHCPRSLFYHRNSAHHLGQLHKCKVDTSRKLESHCCKKTTTTPNCHLHKFIRYDNTFKDKRLLFITKSPVSEILLWNKIRANCVWREATEG